jgi:hypothetical protein
MPGSSSWMPYAPQRVKGLDDDDLITRMQYKIKIYLLHCTNCTYSDSQRNNQLNVTLYRYSLCTSNAVLLTETKYVAHNFLYHFER